MVFAPLPDDFFANKDLAAICVVDQRWHIKEALVTCPGRKFRGQPAEPDGAGLAGHRRDGKDRAAHPEVHPEPHFIVYLVP
jgi:hypothetical protein